MSLINFFSKRRELEEIKKSLEELKKEVKDLNKKVSNIEHNSLMMCKILSVQSENFRKVWDEIKNKGIKIKN